MQIEIKLDKDFERFFYNLKEEYGEDFAKLNGLSDEQLSYNDFLDNFVSHKTVADSSIDGNSNVFSKDIVTLRSEMSKPHEKLMAYNKIFLEMKQEYGLRRAKKWMKAEWNKALYLHDANTSSFIPYSYKGSETVVLKYKDELLLSSFEDLYDLVDEKEELLSEKDNAFCKYTNDLFVWDYNDSWTKVIRVIKKPKTNKFHWIKSANGLSEIVTDNHPVITTSGDKLASCVEPNNDKIITQIFNENLFGSIDHIYCTDIFQDICFRGREYDGRQLENKNGLVCRTAKNKGRKGTNPIDNKITLDNDFGWLLGFILAEGTIGNTINISQQDNEYLEKAIDICDKNHWGYAVYQRESGQQNLVIQSGLLCDVIKHFIHGDRAWNKRLNPKILNCNKEFIKGIVSGVIDGDGTCTSAQGRRIHLRLTSRSLINQLSFIMRSFGFTVREQSPCLYNRKGSFNNSHTIYHMAFTPTQESQDFDSIKIRNHRRLIPYERDVVKSSNKRYEFGYGESTVLNNEVLDLGVQDDFVYDISVETGHFICNNILSHNCFAYDLTKMATEGLFYLPDHKNPEPAKHLETFVDFVKEFISFTSNRTSGAVGLPNLIPYMYYFWYQDVKSGHYPRCQNEETFAKSEIQRLIYGMNQPYTRDGIQSAFINTSIFDGEYFDALFGGAEFPNGEFMIDHKDGIIQFQKWFLEEMSAIKDRGRMFTFPVNSISLLKTDGKFVDESFARWASNHNRKWNDSNIFADKDVTSLSNCCRLKSNIKDIGYFNSIGGSALKVGSVKVSTINLARIAYQSKTESDFIRNLKDITELDLEVLHVIRNIIKKNADRGLLPNFQDGIIDFEHLYNTVGLNGIYEVMRYFGYTYQDEFGYTYYTDKAMSFGKKIFDTLHETIKQFVADKDYMGNIEQIPGEQAAVKFLKADRLLYGNKPVCKVTYIKGNDKIVKLEPMDILPLRGNQWIPLGIKTTLKERIRICSEFDNYCNGGSIMHLNVDNRIQNEEAAWDLLNYATDQGVTYFALNAKLSADDNGHLFYGDYCPECGSPKTAEYTRTVGFYTKVASWSQERKDEFKLRDWHEVDKKGLDS